MTEILKGGDSVEVKLFVSHRVDLNSTIVKNNILTPVYCGAIYKTGIWQEGVIGDNTGDNISSKRVSFCELTVQYWAWKNVEADYYGLCHYRRYLSFSREEGYRNEHNQIYLPFMSSKIIKKYNISNETIIKDYCKKYDAIFSKPAHVSKITAMGANPSTVLDLWLAHQGVFFDNSIINQLLNCIKNVQPTFYDVAIEYLHSNNHRGFNCYIMRKNFFYEMCDFEFTVLFELEKNLNPELLNKYPRTIGYMGEILFGVFQYMMVKTNRKIAYNNLMFFERTEKDIHPIMRYAIKFGIDKLLNKKIKSNIKAVIKNWRDQR